MHGAFLNPCVSTSGMPLQGIAGGLQRTAAHALQGKVPRHQAGDFRGCCMRCVLCTAAVDNLGSGLRSIAIPVWPGGFPSALFGLDAVLVPMTRPRWFSLTWQRAHSNISNYLILILLLQTARHVMA